MLKGKRCLCLMLARGGSKGVPDKNIKPLAGKPLIVHSIEAVQQAGIFDRMILSTDSPRIAELARQAGMEVPFMRPAHLATDTASALDSIVHALDFVAAEEGPYDYVQYIFPTAPLRQARHIREAAELLTDTDSDMVISVCESDHPLQWINHLPDNRSLKNFIKPEHRDKNRQALQPAYRINGAIYLARWEVFAERRDWFAQETIAYVMPRDLSIDIDTPLDFKLAELLIKEQKNA